MLRDKTQIMDYLTRGHLCAFGVHNGYLQTQYVSRNCLKLSKKVQTPIYAVGAVAKKKYENAIPSNKKFLRRSTAS